MRPIKEWTDMTCFRSARMHQKRQYDNISHDIQTDRVHNSRDTTRVYERHNQELWEIQPLVVLGILWLTFSGWLSLVHFLWLTLVDFFWLTLVDFFWLYFCGCIFVVVFLWLYFTGCISLVVFHWLYFAGCISLVVLVCLAVLLCWGCCYKIVFWFIFWMKLLRCMTAAA